MRKILIWVLAAAFFIAGSAFVSAGENSFFGCSHPEKICVSVSGTENAECLAAGGEYSIKDNPSDGGNWESNRNENYRASIYDERTAGIFFWNDSQKKWKNVFFAEISPGWECGENGELEGSFTIPGEECAGATARVIFGECNLHADVELKLDPWYVAMTFEKRKFVPTLKELTPFDNIVCTATVNSDEDFSSDFTMRLLSEVDGQEVVIAQDTQEGILLGGNIKKQIITLPDGKKGANYTWSIEGWPNSWVYWGSGDIKIDDKIDDATKDKLEKIKKILGKKVWCEADISNSKFSSDAVKVNACVHLWGENDAEFNVVTAKDDSKADAGWDPNNYIPYIVSMGRGVYEGFQGFHSVDPFASDPYKQKFGFYADLKEYPLAIDIFSKTDPTKKYDAAEALLKELITAGSCKDKNARLNIVLSYGLFNDSRIWGKNWSFSSFEGYASNNFISINEIYFRHNRISGFPQAEDQSVFIHETGHFFCKLYDEYPIWRDKERFGSLSLDNYIQFETNCVKDPSKFGEYGDKYVNGCFTKGYQAPSLISVMNYFEKKVPRFNVISCGYCLAAMKGDTNPKSMTKNYEECMKMNTVKPGGECERDVQCFSGEVCIQKKCGRY
jgi:hypothetical protein